MNRAIFSGVIQHQVDGAGQNPLVLSSRTITSLIFLRALRPCERVCWGWTGVSKGL
jgi:hypothetical protein